MFLRRQSGKSAACLFRGRGIEPAFFEQAAEEFLREVLGVMGD